MEKILSASAVGPPSIRRTCLWATGKLLFQEAWDSTTERRIHSAFRGKCQTQSNTLWSNFSHITSICQALFGLNWSNIKIWSIIRHSLSSSGIRSTSLIAVVMLAGQVNPLGVTAECQPWEMPDISGLKSRWCKVHGVPSGAWHTAGYVGIFRSTQKPSPRLQRQLFCRNRMKHLHDTRCFSSASVFCENASFTYRYCTYSPNLYFFFHLKTVLLENGLITGTPNYILPLCWRPRQALSV